MNAALAEVPFPVVDIGAFTLGQYHAELLSILRQAQEPLFLYYSDTNWMVMMDRQDYYRRMAL